MGLFNRRKKEFEPTITKIEFEEPKHEHVWKDFPWYIEYTYNNGDLEINVIEPYVCVSCGERKNKNLEHFHRTDVGMKQVDTLVDGFKKTYRNYTRPRAIVEDMISDTLLVKDPDYLRMYEEVRGLPHKGVGSSMKYKVQRDAPTITMP